jgi:hypothetical protein
LKAFQGFAASRGFQTIDQVDLEALNAFRSVRTVCARTWTKELGTIRHFFRHCLDNEWIFRNWADKVPMPKNLPPAEREPYSPNEIAKIIAACAVVGRGAYERLRAPCNGAPVAVHRAAHLRCGNLGKNRIRDGEIFVRTTKNGKPVRLPVHPDLKAALAVLPLPREAGGTDCPYFFWSGHGSTDSFIRDAKRTLSAVFELTTSSMPWKRRRTLCERVHTKQRRFLQSNCGSSRTASACLRPREWDRANRNPECPLLSEYTGVVSLRRVDRL